MNSSVYGSVVFDLTLFNEVTRKDHVISNIKASVIDSCIEVIVGLPDIRSHRLIHLIPSYFDTPDPTYLDPQTNSMRTSRGVPHDSTALSLLVPTTIPAKNTAARSRGSVPCSKCSAFIAMGYDHTLCSMAGRPYTPQQRFTKTHPTIREEDLIKKSELLDPLEDDDDIVWKHNPFDAESVTESGEIPEELMAMITFEGSPQLQTRLKALVLEFIDVFATKVRAVSADVEPMKIVVDREKWRLPCNRHPPSPKAHT